MIRVLTEVGSLAPPPLFWPNLCQRLYRLKFLELKKAAAKKDDYKQTNQPFTVEAFGSCH
ncbi:MAG TPA: hypothetical protein GX529_03750 [Firmicutes bacterium]|nr:hypothetical protein [Candidatus Fermentithermobacillaceae bacterium]